MIRKLTEIERQLVGTCLRAAAKGLAFPPEQSVSFIGLPPDRLQKVADAFPTVDDVSYTSDAFVAIDGSLREVGRAAREQQPMVSHLDFEEIERVRVKWIGGK